MPEPSVTPGVLRGDNQLTLMTWNVQHAGAERSLHQVAWIVDQSVDVAVLTEVPAGHSGDIFVHRLADRGFSTCVSGDSGTDYRVLIVARRCELEPWPSVRASSLPHRCVAVRLHLEGQQLVGLLGLYVPSRGNQSRRNVDKRAFQHAVTSMLPGLRNSFRGVGPILIAGDLNVLEPGHQPHHAVFGTWEYSFYRAFHDLGYIDAYRHVRPSEHEHSWYGRSGAGYRFDHVFVSDASFVADCYYDHRPREAALSDHSAMMLLTSINTCRQDTRDASAER